MKSNLFRIGIAAILLAVILAGCAPPEPEIIEKEVITEVEVVVTQIVEVEGETIVEEVIVVATPEPEPEEGPLRIALILPSSIKDMAWSQSMYEPLKVITSALSPCAILCFNSSRTSSARTYSFRWIVRLVVFPSWQYTQSRGQYLNGTKSTPRLNPSRLEGTGPNRYFFCSVILVSY